ncbi:outer membrane protein assembly factor BamB family protein [Candidatus Pelagibacter sp.]|uniref:PQQ-binding-like beta-propeller repeat protein n=1 Tax=Candidatus Pelagibacter sp. TaxID=2024849 RepID=UPI003F861B54
MNKIFSLVFFIFLLSNCSFNKNSSFWSQSKKIISEDNPNRIIKFEEDEAISLELNPELEIKLTNQPNENYFENNLDNNNGRVDFNSDLDQISKFKFSKIKDFYKYDPKISFTNNGIIFFDKKGTIFMFDNQSNLIWSTNIYTKKEMKLNPVLQFVNNGSVLIVTDSIAKYYSLDLNDGKLIWSKINKAPFNSQIKIQDDNFFTVDFENTIRSFSIKDGSENWNVKTDNSLVRSQKKLSVVIVNDVLYFNNSLGDVTAIDMNEGSLIWQTPTQSSLIYENAFSLKSSDLIADDKSLYISNNKNQFFSVDMKTGIVNWENKINSNLRSTIVENLIFSISLEGYLVITEKNTGNIIRVTDIFKGIKEKKRSKIKPIGFVVGLDKIYLTTSNGKLFILDTISGKTTSILKVDSEQVSRPFISNQSLYIVKDNAVIKLN